MKTFIPHSPAMGSVAHRNYDHRADNPEDYAHSCGRVIRSSLEKYGAMLYTMEAMIAVQSILDRNPDHRAKLFQLKAIAAEARKKLQGR